MREKGRQAQAVSSWPPGESGGGGQKPEKTLEGPLAFVVAREENIPDPSITGAGNPGGPKGRGAASGPRGTQQG